MALKTYVVNKSTVVLNSIMHFEKNISLQSTVVMEHIISLFIGVVTAKTLQIFSHICKTLPPFKMNFLEVGSWVLTTV